MSGDRTAELERTVRELRSDLEHLRHELASEVRTRRVVVVETDGFERIVAEGHGEYGQLQVRCRADTADPTYVALEAADGAQGGRYAVLYLAGDGDGYGQFGVSEAEGGFEGAVQVFAPNVTDTVTRFDHRGVTTGDDDGARGPAASRTPQSALASQPSPQPAERRRQTSSAADDTYSDLMDLVASKCGNDFMLGLDQVVGIRMVEAERHGTDLLASTQEELELRAAEAKDAHTALRVIAGASQAAMEALFVPDAVGVNG